MGKFFSHKKGQQQWLCYLCPQQERYQSAYYREMTNRKLEGIILPFIREEARGRVFFYNIETRVSLSQLLKPAVSEEKLLQLLISLSKAAMRVQPSVPLEHLLWDAEAIYIKPQTNQTDFLVSYILEDWHKYTLRDKLYSIVENAKVMPVQHHIKKMVLKYLESYPDALFSQLHQFLTQLYYRLYGNREYSGHLGLTSRLDEHGIHIGDYVEIASYMEKPVGELGDMCLVRSRTQERIVISKEKFYIGKEAPAVDYCITDNAAISRSHACIVYENSKYYIQDMGSTNRTYVNSLEVSGGRRQELKPGCRITLANEEFYFQ